MQLANLPRYIAAFILVFTSFEASALRCFSSETLTPAPGEEFVYTGVTRILLQMPAKGAVGPVLTFLGPEGASRSLMICTRNNGRPFCSIEGDGGGFFYASFKGKSETITVTGVPGIFFQDNGKTRPAFARGPDAKIVLTETEATECTQALSRAVQSTKPKAAAKKPGKIK